MSNLQDNDTTVTRPDALRAIRPYGYMADDKDKARIGALLLGYWSVSPERCGPRTVEAIHSDGFDLGLYETRTLRECYAMGRGMAHGRKSGERRGAREISAWVVESDTLADAKRVGNWLV